MPTYSAQSASQTNNRISRKTARGLVPQIIPSWFNQKMHKMEVFHITRGKMVIQRCNAVRRPLTHRKTHSVERKLRNASNKRWIVFQSRCWVVLQSFVGLFYKGEDGDDANCRGEIPALHHENTSAPSHCESLLSFNIINNHQQWPAPLVD